MAQQVNLPNGGDGNGKKNDDLRHRWRRRSTVNTLGPVENLESHVPPEWWREIFNSLYLKTDGDVVMDDQLTAREVDLFQHFLGLQANDRILDLCCGQGRHTLELARRGFPHVEGLDRSSALIQRARRTARTEELSVRFREGDARRLPHADDSLDAVLLLGNSFGYFSDAEDDLRVLEEIHRVLAPGGRLLVDVTDGEHIRRTFEPRAWEWIGKSAFVCRERSLSGDGSRLISRELITHAQRGVIADQFYAERLYTGDELLSLLQQAGFTHPTVHAEIDTVSERAQDLGMMARRLVITAPASKAGSASSNGTGQATRKVIVVMGDPDIADSVKPADRFDEDDHETIRRLRSALAELTQYDFAFRDDHSTLLDDMRAADPHSTLVFNLCDEGFNNRARWELHVPALLEWIGLPYTGAAPQSLAFCYDKSLVRGVAKELGIPVPEAAFIDARDYSVEMPFAFPVILKPNLGDSSVGITQRSVANNPEELLSALSALRNQFGYGTPFVVEQFLPGKDLSVGVIGNPGQELTFLPITEEDYSHLPPELPRICGYEAKWLPDSPYWGLPSVRAELPDDTVAALHASCLRLFERLECRDYARFDWRLDAQGRPHLLEVNPNPGWCWDGHLAKMAELAGLSYAEMLAAILSAAERRLAEAPPLATPLQQTLNEGC